MSTPKAGLESGSLNLAFIGGGTMAEAIIAGVLGRGVAEAGSIVVGEPVLRRREYLSGRYGTRTVVDNHSAIEGADIVVIAVKPQQLAEVLEELSGSLNASQSILSIVAGASVQSISEGANHAAVIRVMPNTPAQVGQGMTVWTASPEVPEAHREAAGEIFDSLGTATYVAEEKYLDMATALSASGPAYVFLFLESLIDAGVYMGLPREMAQTLALQTIEGSAALARESGRHPADLRNMVTSPGGTTAEALLALEDAGFRAAVMNAVIAAHEKALELG